MTQLKYRRSLNDSIESAVERLCEFGPFAFRAEQDGQVLFASLRRTSEFLARLSDEDAMNPDVFNPFDEHEPNGWLFKSNIVHDGLFDITIKAAIFRWLTAGPEPREDDWADALDQIEVLSANPLILWVPDDAAEAIKARWTA